MLAAFGCQLSVVGCYNYLYIDLFMIFCFYFTCINISPRQTISSHSLASTLNLACANDVTCSCDVIMRKRQVLTLTLTLRVPRFSLRPKQFALCQMCSNILLQGLSWTKVDPNIVVSLNYSRPTLNLLKVLEEFCHRGLQTTKAQTSLHIRAVWSAPLLFTNWIVSYLNLLQARLHFFFLVSVAVKAGFWYDLIGNSEDRFCRIDARICIYIHVNADPIHKPVSCDMHIENV